MVQTSGLDTRLSVINKDNYALGTLCMLDTKPKHISLNAIKMVQKITKSIAFLLDLQTEQKQVTSHKMLQALAEFENEYPNLSLRDFKVFLSLFRIARKKRITD